VAAARLQLIIIIIIIIIIILTTGTVALNLVEYVLHGHKKALSLVQSELVVFIVATRQHTSNVGDEGATVMTTATVTNNQVVRWQRHFHRLAAAQISNTNIDYDATCK